MSSSALPSTVTDTEHWNAVDWVPEPPPTDLIFDDGEPLESNRHRIAMNVLIDSVHQHLHNRTDYFTGGNMFVYYSRTQARNRDFRGPDFFVVLGVDGTQSRQGWVVWDEGGRYPDVIVEFMSPSTAAVDLGEKKVIYSETFHTSDYFVYDPFDPNSLQGWHLQGRGYEPLPSNERGQLWCESLGLWLGPWEGTLLRETAVWARFFTPEGELVPLPAEWERQRAEEERQRAEAERQRAETAEAALNAAQEREKRLSDRLRALGIDPDQV